MNKYIAILLLLFSGSVFAESYLCIAEEGAGVSYNPVMGTFDSTTYDVSDQKFILSDTNGKWEVKKFGRDVP
jgi:hypothetical protein